MLNHSLIIIILVCLFASIVDRQETGRERRMTLGNKPGLESILGCPSMLYALNQVSHLNYRHYLADYVLILVKFQRLL